MSAMPPPTVPPPPPGGGSYTPPPPPPGGAPAGGSDRTLMVVLSYVWILFLVPLFTSKQDREIQWHAKNGMALTIAEVIIWIAVAILGMVMRSTVGCGPFGLGCVVWIAFLVVRILCIVKGVGGQRFRIPVVSDMAEKF